MEIFLKAPEGLDNLKIIEGIKKSLEGLSLKKVLIIPPDITRFYSNAGFITGVYYDILIKMGVKVDILPALGTHEAMDKEDCHKMYPNIPLEAFIYHNWRQDIVKIGEVPCDYMSAITEGLWEQSVSVEVNRLIMDTSYDLILSIGQVVPHEVIGMANHSKNIFVGVGGSDMINKSHMVGAVYGMERMMGRDHTPVRKMFDYSSEKFLKDRPIIYVLTVTSAPHDKIITHGLFIGDTRAALSEAIKLSQAINIQYVEKPVNKCIVYLTPLEFKSTWLGNKAIYRTRMLIADGGELIILGEGITKFGEDERIDKLIRKYGYRGRLEILEKYKQNEDLKENMGAAAHLIHGSSDGRFKITYAVKNILKSEIESVNYNAADYDEYAAYYDLKNLKEVFNYTQNGEEIYYINNPALGLWMSDKHKGQ